jgi:hypothetical protein
MSVVSICCSKNAAGEAIQCTVYAIAVVQPLSQRAAVIMSEMRDFSSTTDPNSTYEDVRVMVTEEDLVGSASEITVTVTVLPVMGIVAGAVYV